MTAPPPGAAGGSGLTVDHNAPSPQQTLSAIVFNTASDGSIFTSVAPASGPLAPATPTAGGTPAPTAATPFVTTIVTTNTPTASPAPAAGPTVQGPILAAIIVPIVAVLALIPLGYIAWLHYRNKRRGRRLSSPDFGDMSAPQPQHNSQLMAQQPPQPRPATKLAPVTLPVPFKESDRIRSGALGVYEVPPPPPPPPPSDTLSGSTLRHAPAPGGNGNGSGNGGAPVIYEHFRDQRESGRPSSELEPPAHLRAPSPTLPSPPAQPPHWRPASDAWPLPNGGPLPDPAAPPSYEAYQPPYEYTNKPLPAPLGGGASAARAAPRHPAAPAPANGRSEALAAPASLQAPSGPRGSHASSAARPPSSSYEGTPTGPAFPAPLQPRHQPASAGGEGRREGARREGYRDSDLVSEMSVPPATRSAVSSMTAGGGRRKSGARDADAVSEVSVDSMPRPRAL